MLAESDETRLLFWFKGTPEDAPPDGVALVSATLRVGAVLGVDGGRTVKVFAARFGAAGWSAFAREV